MNSLRTRLALAFAVAALVPMSVLGLLAQEIIVERTRDAHARQLDHRVESTRRKLAELTQADRRALDRLCSHDLVIDGLLLDLAARRYGPGTEARMERLLPPLTLSLGLESLTLLEGGEPPARGRVLGAGHYPERVGTRDLTLLDEVTQAGERSFVSSVRVRDDDGSARDVPMMLTACSVARDGAEIAVVAGRSLAALLAAVDLGPGDPVRVVLTAPDAPLPDDVPHGGGAREVERLADAAGDPVVRVMAAIDDRDLEAQLDALRARHLGVAALALLLALGLTGALALRLTRPLRALEQAAQRVGQGDLGSTVDASRGGREVVQALNAFNQMTHELTRARLRLRRVERIAAWRAIAQRIAHEIKNPLSPIQLSIETMRKTKAKRHPDFDEIFEESTLTILEEVERLKHIVSEFSRFARLPRPTPTELDLVELAQHVARLHGSEDEARVVVHGPKTVVRVDREQLVQVLVNLVQNGLAAGAERHGAPGARVVVRVEPTPFGAELSVDDNGPGIAPEERDRIFEPYYTTRAEGTGLGLAIVHRIVGDHGGGVEVEDAPLGGARFRITLPRSGPPLDAGESAGEGMTTFS